MINSNPTLNKNTFRVESISRSNYLRMTAKGTALKATLLLLISMVTALWTWQKFFTGNDIHLISSLMSLGSIGGLICAIVTMFKKEWSPITSPIYAALEGLAIGSISALFEAKYPGIAIQTASLTFGTFLSMFIIYSTGIIKVTDKLKMGISAALGGIALIYFVSMIMSFFGGSLSFIHGSSPISIGFSFIVVIVGAMSLLIDFDTIREGEAQGAPKYMEWYGAFGLIVGLIYLYIHILILLSKLRDRKNN